MVNILARFEIFERSGFPLHCGLLLMTYAYAEPDVRSKEFPFARFCCRFWKNAILACFPSPLENPWEPLRRREIQKKYLLKPRSFGVYGNIKLHPWRIHLATARTCTPQQGLSLIFPLQTSLSVREQFLICKDYLGSPLNWGSRMKFVFNNFGQKMQIDSVWVDKRDLNLVLRNPSTSYYLRYFETYTSCCRSPCHFISRQSKPSKLFLTCSLT